MAKKHIYLIRHGQTDYNLKGIVQGRGVDSELNNTGKQQARLFFEHYQHVPFEAVLTSTLKRTHQTIEPFIAAGHQHQVKVELDEIDWGIFEGVEHDAILQGAYQNIIQSWSRGMLDNKIEGGESAAELFKRQQPLVEELHDISFDNFLICSHGRAIRSLLCGLLRRPLQDMDQFKHDNTCLYKLSFGDNGFKIDLENDLRHLSKLNAAL
jgi:2,3-bisphosphoglycerate-dependent phosphoglycerate mutase